MTWSSPRSLLLLLAGLGVSCAGLEGAYDDSSDLDEAGAFESPSGFDSERPDAPLLSEFVAGSCPAIAVTSADILVGADPGEEAEVELTISNPCETGDALVIDEISLDDLDDSFSFLTDVSEGFVLESGETATVRFAFEPQGDFMHLGDLTIRSNDPLMPETGVLLVGLPHDVVHTKSGASPSADAGPRQVGTTGDTHVLDATGSSDPEGDTLSYRWTWVFPATGSGLGNADLNDPLTDTANFVSDVDGQYRLRLVVSDGTSVDKDFLWVWTTTGANSAPTADAAQVSGEVGSAVSLDGTGSSDPEGDSLSYTWSFASVASGSGLTNSDITDRTTDSASFTPDVTGDYRMRLVVNDGVLSDKDFAWAYVCAAGNTAPTADAGSDSSESTGDSHTVDGSGSSDPEGDSLSYEWKVISVPSGSSVATSDLSGAASDSASFTSDVDGEYRLRLEVSDGCETSRSNVYITTTTTTPTYTYSFADDVQPIFDADCTSGCHSGSSPSAGLDLSTDGYDDIVNVAARQLGTMDLVEPSDSTNSYLSYKTAGTQADVGGSGSSMPAGSTLSSSDQNILDTWIDEGAPDN